MDLEDIKRGLRAEIKKRENETYATFQCNVRQMCKDVLAKLEEQESEIAELKAEIKRKETVGQRWFERCMEARSENIKLKCALWIARAKRALEKIAWFKLWNASISTMNPEDCARQEFDKWKKNLGKFLKKAEEYK